jgi:hypothetical protein
MMVAGILVFLLGTGIIIVTLVGLVIGVHYRLLLRHLRSAPRLSCADVASRTRLPGRVLVTGTMAPGPAGLLRSPAYDRPCVWYRTGLMTYDQSGASFNSVEYQSAHFRRDSNGPISVADCSGAVLFDIALIRHANDASPFSTTLTEYPKLSLAHRADAGSATARLEQAGLIPVSAYGIVLRHNLVLREQFIEPGSQVTVLARPWRTTSGAVILGRRGALSINEPDAWIKQVEADIVAGVVLLRLFAIGLAIMAVGAALTAIGIS